jgi:hypothetical protein
LLLILAALFPPWTWRTYYSGFSPPGFSYGFLFSPPKSWAKIDLPRLFVECLLIVLVMGGLFLIFRRTKAEGKSDTTAVAPKKRRLLLFLTITLAALVLCLSFVSYAAIREIQRLDAYIQKVKTELSSPLHLEDLGPLPEGVTDLTQLSPCDAANSWANALTRRLDRIREDLGN